MPASLTATARTAASAVRDLTRATTGGAGYRTPVDIDELLIDLAALAHDLPQLLAQAVRWLDCRHRSGRIGHDNHRDPQDGVHEAIGDLERAVREARSLAYTLDSARQNTSHLTALNTAGGEGGDRR